MLIKGGIRERKPEVEKKKLVLEMKTNNEKYLKDKSKNSLQHNTDTN